MASLSESRPLRARSNFQRIYRELSENIGLCVVVADRGMRRRETAEPGSGLKISWCSEHPINRLSAIALSG
jgi:hypothetical protein